MASLNSASWYNTAEHSDITLKFSGREIKCHKLILSSGSDYFKKLFSDNSRFVERNQAAIELKEDDPDALEVVLQYLYGIKMPMQSVVTVLNLRHLLEVSKTAEKYLVSDLARSAFDIFSMTVNRLKDLDDIVEAINTIRACSDQPKHSEVAERLVEQNRSALLKRNDYRQQLSKDEILAHLDLFVHKADMIEMELGRCFKCGQETMGPSGANVQGKEMCSYSRGMCSMRKRARCWMSKQELAEIGMPTSKMPKI